MTAPFVHIDPLFGAGGEGADAMLRIAERFARIPTYGAEAAPEEQGKRRYAPGVPQRYDAALNFVQTGGRFGRPEDPRTLAGRTNYLRATYFYEKPSVDGIEPFLRHSGLVEAARTVHGRPRVVPSIVYANLLLPGQELAVHTDVPEFRGADRRACPQWLLVVMLHSGLFDAWRRPIATGIAYFGACQGGALAFYPDGADGAPRTIDARHDTAIVLDTDTVFHGVDRVAGPDDAAPPFRPGMELQYAGGDTWQLSADGELLASYRWEHLRYSVSWKAWCYEDEADQRRAERHEDDLSLESILDTLEADLRARGQLSGPRPPEDDFARRLIETYIRFPAPSVKKGAVAALAAGKTGGAGAGLARGDDLHAEPRLVGECARQVEAPLLVRREAVVAQAALGEARDLRGQLARFRERAPGLDDAVRQAHAERLVAGDAAAGEEEIERMTHADQTRQSHGAAVDQRDSPAPAVDAEDGVARGDA